MGSITLSSFFEESKARAFGVDHVQFEKGCKGKVVLVYSFEIFQKGLTSVFGMQSAWEIRAASLRSMTREQWIVMMINGARE